MRRIRRLLITLCVLGLLVGLGIPARGEDSRNPYQPVKVETIEDGAGEPRIVRTYQLSPVDDPAGIPTTDFEDGGWVYHLTDMDSEEKVGTDSRQITRTVTKSSETDDMKKILKSLDAAMRVETDDGYVGTLQLDHNSATVELFTKLRINIVLLKFPEQCIHSPCMIWIHLNVPCTCRLNIII